MARSNEMKRRLDAAEKSMAEYLKSSRLRMTPERMEILRMAFKMKAHFGVDELYRALEESGYHVSRTTVYNTVEVLLKCGLLQRHIFEAHQALYEVAGANHCHLVCSSCGSVTEVDVRQMAPGFSSIDFGSFTPAYFSTTVYGLCKRCSDKGSHDDGSHDEDSYTGS